MSKNKFYAVAKGLKPGIYDTWPEAQKLVTGYPGAVFKSFSTRQEAEQFMKQKNPSFKTEPYLSSLSTSKFANFSIDKTSHQIDPAPLLIPTKTSPSASISNVSTNQVTKRLYSPSGSGSIETPKAVKAPRKATVSSKIGEPNIPLHTLLDITFVTAIKKVNEETISSQAKVASDLSCDVNYDPVNEFRLNYWPDRRDMEVLEASISQEEVESRNMSGIAPYSSTHPAQINFQPSFPSPKAFFGLHLENLLKMRKRAHGVLEYLRQGPTSSNLFIPTVMRPPPTRKVVTDVITEEVATKYNSNTTLFSNNSTPPIVCFLDGAAKKNPGPAGSGITFQVPILSYSRSSDVSKTLLPRIIMGGTALSHGFATNNFSELRAVHSLFHALERLPKRMASIANTHNFLAKRDIHIYMDSMWAMGMVTKKMKPTSVDLSPYVFDLHKQIDEYAKKYSANISFFWIRGHSHALGNEVADALANYGCEFATNNKLEYRTHEPVIVLEHLISMKPTVDSVYLKQLNEYVKTLNSDMRISTHELSESNTVDSIL